MTIQVTQKSSTAHEAVPVDVGSRSRRRSILQLGVVIVFAVVVRIYLHPQTYEPMDRAAVIPAQEILAGEFTPVSFSSHRYALIFPTAVALALFGETLQGMSIYPLSCSIGSIILAFLIGQKLGGDRVGIVAAFVLAVLPLDIHLAGRVYPDGPQALFVGVFLWLLLVSQSSKNGKMAFYSLASGLALGVSFLCKVSSIFLFPAIILYGILEKSARRPLCLALVTVSLIFAAERAIDYALTGDALSRIHSLTGRGSGTTKTYGYSSHSPHLFPKQFFLTPLMYGLHMYALLPALAYALIRNRRRYLLLIICTTWFIGYTWLGTSSISSYKPLAQLVRYLAVVNVPICVLISAWIIDFKSTPLRVLTLTTLAGAGLFMANVTVADGEPTIGLRRAAAFLQRQPDAHPVYANVRSDLALKFFLSDDENREVRAYGTTANRTEIVDQLATLSNVYVVVDRNRIRASRDRYPDEQYPWAIDNPPTHWKEVLVIDNPSRSTSYIQLRLLRLLTEFPFAPSRLSKKVASTIDRSLDGRDIVIYFTGSP